MFSKPVVIVSNTKLVYAQFKVGEEIWALQTYENSVRLQWSQEHTTMVLPVPVKDAKRVHLVNDGVHESQLFDTMHTMFEEQETVIDSLGYFGRGHSYGFGSSSAPLPVVVSGSYEVTIVPSFGDLHRCDKSVFSFDDVKLAELLAKYEKARTYVYLVCKMRDNAKFHPFSYLYQMDAGDEYAFIPTMHYHPSAKDERLVVNSFQHPGSIFAHKSADSGYADDWDHEIIVMGTVGSPAYVGHSTVKLQKLISEKALGHFASLVRSARCNIDESKMKMRPCAYRVIKKGNHLNEDIVFASVWVEHPGIFCDECKEFIRNGKRFMCTTCKNYDMCAGCFAKGNHPSSHPVVVLCDMNATEAWQAREESNQADKRKLSQARTAYASLSVALRALDRAGKECFDILSTD
jgi:hypothetical protein